MVDGWILQDDEPVPMPDGVVGGDGAGYSYSVRWLHTNGHAAITVYWYAVDEDERRSEPVGDGYRYDVERATAWAMFESADDIGGTETWSDTRYDNPIDVAFKTESEADEQARLGAERDRQTFIRFVSWDGVSIPNL